MADNSPATQADIKHLESLVTSLTHSLEQELRNGLSTVTDKLDAMNARLERQGGWLRDGS